MLQPQMVRASFLIDQSLAGMRLDSVLYPMAGILPREARRLRSEGRIRIDGRAELVGFPRLPAGATVEVLEPSARPELLAEMLPLPILQQDARMLFIDKLAGMPVAPGPGHPAGTLANALRGLGCPLSTVEGPLRPGIVHRLDAYASGVMVVAKDNATHRLLVDLFKHHAARRLYLALVHAEPSWDEELVEVPLGYRRRGRKARAACPGGQRSVTRFRVLTRTKGFAMIQAEPQTGRTHQIRIHLACLGHPICGDTLYGGGQPAARAAAALGMRRLALHASLLVFDSLAIAASAPLPPDLAAALERLGIADRAEAR